MPPSQFHPKLGCRNRNFTLNWGVGIVIFPNSGVLESELGKKIPVGIVPSIGGGADKKWNVPMQRAGYASKFANHISFPLF